jgi:hypothetical protein
LLHGFGVSGGDGRQVWMIVVDVVCIGTVLVALGYRMRPDRHPDTVARRAGAQAHPPATHAQTTSRDGVGR